MIEARKYRREFLRCQFGHGYIRRPVGLPRAEPSPPVVGEHLCGWLLTNTENCITYTARTSTSKPNGFSTSAARNLGPWFALFSIEMSERRVNLKVRSLIDQIDARLRDAERLRNAVEHPQPHVWPDRRRKSRIPENGSALIPDRDSGER